MPRNLLSPICRFLAAFGLLAGQAIAQDAALPSDDVYPRAHFAADSVSNAYDILQRVPGFAIVEADEDARGYAAALGNVLVDGARPSSKREKTVDVLKRIPAKSVQRIELLRTGTPGVDMNGFPVLANVVRVRATATQAAVETGATAAADGWAAVPVEIEYGWHGDERALDIALKTAPELDDDTGSGRIRTFAGDGGTLSEDRLQVRNVQDAREATASWQQSIAAGRMTVMVAFRRDEERVDTRTAPVVGDGDAEQSDETETTRETEAGARYVRPLGEHTTVDFIASSRKGRLQHGERSQEGSEDETFDERTDSGETIGRIELAREYGPQASLKASLETTRNTLESESSLTQGGVPVALPGSDVRITEMRQEAALAFAWSATDALAFEAGFRYESSTISQTGDSPLRREFAYPKPRLAIRWDAGLSDQLRISLSREVSQLDFEDFVASASLDTDVITAGNASLEPEKTWRLAAEWEHRFGADAAVTLGWTHERIEDVVDRVLVTTPDDVFDAPGNIGDGRRDTLSLQASAPLEWIGLAGTRVRAAILYRDSRVTDPVTGATRGISEEKPVEGEIELTRELPAWRGHWGLLIEHIAESETKYRFDEVERKSEQVGWTLYIESHIGRYWRVRAEATDLFGRDFLEVRDSYGGPRSEAALETREVRHRTTPGLLTIRFRRSFGG